MISLLLTILCSTGIFVVFKLTSRYKVDNLQAITVNYVIASGMGYILSGGNFIPSEIVQKPWFYLSLITGLAFITVFNLFAESTKRAGIALTSVASKMSVIWPVLLGFIILKDPLSLLKIMGIIMAMLAFFFTFYKKEGKSNINIGYVLFPVFLFLGNGFIDSIIKIVEHFHIDGDYMQFLTMVFLTALVLGIISSVFRRSFVKVRWHMKSVYAGIILGVLNWYSTYFFIYGMQHFKISFYVPVINVSIVSLSAIIGYFFFREYLARINWFGIILALVSIILIATA